MQRFISGAESQRLYNLMINVNRVCGATEVAIGEAAAGEEAATREDYKNKSEMCVAVVAGR